VSNLRASGSSAGARGEWDTWTLMFMAESRSRLARRFAVLAKGGDPALLGAEIVHAHDGSLREFLPQQRTECFDPCFDRSMPTEAV
jgi:hypothetical protein